MKTCGQIFEEEKQWHDWYAWRPVLALCNKDETRQQWVWRENVERQRRYYSDGSSWVYRVKQ